MCACMYAICMWPRGWQSSFFHLLVKCFTLDVAWKGSLIEKHSGRGICHPPRCSVTTLIHAPPDQNQEASHSASQQEGVHFTVEEQENGKEGRENTKTRRPALLNIPMHQSHIIIQSHAYLCCVSHFYVGGSAPGMSVSNLFLACSQLILLFLSSISNTNILKWNFLVK